MGAALVAGLQNYLATIGDLVTVVIGLIFIVCVSFFRRKFVGEFLPLRRRRSDRAIRREPLRPETETAPAAEAA